MGKPRFRESLVNMLGEFVNLNRNPDFRLSNSSEKFIAEAVKQEKKHSTTSNNSITNIYIGLEPVRSSRNRSSHSACIPDSKVSLPESRRLSAPLLRPRSLLKKFKSHSLESRNSTISESDESVLAELPRPKRTRNNSQSSSLLGDIAKYCNEMAAIHTQRPYLVPLRPKSTSIRPTMWRNGNSRYTRSIKLKAASKKKQRKSIPWFPRRTVPEPFLFTLREETAPIRATYSMKFLEQMLEEKKKKEEQDLAKSRKQFFANPVPETTYVSNSNFYRLKETKLRSSGKFLSPLRLSMARSQSEPTLSGRISFKAHPVPLTTYVRPSSTADEERAQKRAHRAMELLLRAKEPFGMSDHSIRSHVQYRIRHLPICYEPKPSFRPNITKSVPDFRLLQREFANKLQEARETRPPTVTEPFKFHDEGVSKHLCENMRTKPAVVKFNKDNFKSGKLKVGQPNKRSNRTMSSLSSGTFNS
ncbi:hypothetical protein FO519_000012 [Halicephalobus sp. NKZ332]|nr:hypothetical protein FO519_000012 [Halicephalobus sp. NKZ332]